MALDQETLNKIIILKIVNQLPGIRQGMLADAAVDSLQMNFIEYSLALAELKESKLVHQAIRKSEPHLDAANQAVERLDITSHGLEVLQALEHQIPASLQKWLQRRIIQLSGEKHQIEAHSSRLQPTAAGEWLLILERFEQDNPNFRLELTFPTKAMAEKAASAWETASLDLYEIILQHLLAD